MELSFLALRVCMFKSTMQAAPTACGWTLVQASMSPEPTTILEGITPSRQHAASTMDTPLSSLCGNLKRITLNQQKRDYTLARARTHTHTHTHAHTRTHTHTKERIKSHHSCTAPKLTQTMNGDGGFGGPSTAPVFFIVKLCCSQDKIQR